MSKLNVIVEGLRSINVPSVRRPRLGPNDEPTEELVCWGITFHAYSEIVHVRTVLEGLIALSEMRNTPSGNILARHLFEWTAHACYMSEKLEWLVTSRQWKTSFDLLVRTDTGNAWVKNHGAGYDVQVSLEEILEPLDINTLIAAYAKYQKKQYGKSTVHDSYGYLSEYSHPNAACFVQYRSFQDAEAHLVAPPSRSSYGGIEGFVLEWLIFMHELLKLAKEDMVRKELVQILTVAAGTAG